MPAISIDTFFACALMVILVLSAMATTSKILYPHINNDVDAIAAERYREISKYMLLNDGNPSNWGQNGEIFPETFGLAKTGSHNSYDLDIDKVSRLNSENLWTMSYAQIFTAVKMPDVSFKIEIKPLFVVSINLTTAFEAVNETTYQFEIQTKKHGVPIQTEMKHYVIADDFLEASSAYASSGKTYVNVTLSNSVEGPALFVVFAKATFDTKIASFDTYAFSHSSSELKSANTFLRLSPLNYTLIASLLHSGIDLSKVYALTYNYNAILTQISSSNQSAMYDIPHFLDSSATLLVATGWNSTTFFEECTAYPQIPVQTGSNFADSTALSNVFANTYVIAVDSAFYECTILLGSPRK
jgi:hypothetical protein